MELRNTRRGRSKSPVLLAITIAITFFIFNPTRGDDGNADTLTKVGDTVPSFKVRALDGSEISAQTTRGKVTLICFFATWCGPCMEELPQMQTKIWEKFKDRSFVMIAIGREHTEEEMKTFAAAKPAFTFAIAPDPKRENYSLFAKNFIPRCYLVDADGKILFQAVGYDSAEIDQLVKLVDTATTASTHPVK